MFKQDRPHRFPTMKNPFVYTGAVLYAPDCIEHSDGKLHHDTPFVIERPRESDT